MLLNCVQEAEFSKHQGWELKKRAGIALDPPQLTSLCIKQMKKDSETVSC